MSRFDRSDCDVDYLFGAVSIGQPLIDWSGNCGKPERRRGTRRDPARLGRKGVAPRHGRLAHLAGQHRKVHTTRVPMAGGHVVGKTGRDEIEQRYRS